MMHMPSSQSVTHAHKKASTLQCHRNLLAAECYHLCHSPRHLHTDQLQQLQLIHRTNLLVLLINPMGSMSPAQWHAHNNKHYDSLVGSRSHSNLKSPLTHHKAKTLNPKPETKNWNKWQKSKIQTLGTWIRFFLPNRQQPNCWWWAMKCWTHLESISHPQVANKKKKLEL